jgi:hypothetical protein
MCFGSTTAPRNRSGRNPSITSPMLALLREHLLEKPDEDLDAMVLFIWDEFGKLLSRWSVRRVLSSVKWSPKVMRRIARGRNADLRDYYAYLVSYATITLISFLISLYCLKCTSINQVIIKELVSVVERGHRVA